MNTDELRDLSPHVVAGPAGGEKADWRSHRDRACADLVLRKIRLDREAARDGGAVLDYREGGGARARRAPVRWVTRVRTH